MMAKTSSKWNPITYVKEVKSETKKVTWPTKDETIKSTIAVFIMVALAAAFLFLADQIMAFAIRFILGL